MSERITPRHELLAIIKDKSNQIKKLEKEVEEIKEEVEEIKEVYGYAKNVLVRVENKKLKTENEALKEGIQNAINNQCTDYCRISDLKELLDKRTRNKVKELKEISFDEPETIFKAYGKPFTSGRHLWDWITDKCDIKIKPY